MKNLLMATDLSVRSDRALERALSLAREHDAKLTIAHVVDSDLPPLLADAQERAAQEVIQEHVDTFVTGGEPGPSIEVITGRPYVDILEISETAEADLVILGMHREDAIKDMFRGTTVERIIRAGDVPVLLVKDLVSGPYQRVMVGVDFSVYSRRAVEFAIRFAPRGEFHLVHAYDVPFKGFLRSYETRREITKQHQAQFQEMIDGEMASFLAGLGPNVPKILRVMKEGAAREVIFQQFERIKPDLLVIGTHGRTGVSHALLGSVAEDPA